MAYNVHGANTDFQYIVAKVTGVDFKTVGNTSVYTVPTGYRFIYDSVYFEPTSVTGFTLGPQYNLGTNSTSFNNMTSGAGINTGTVGQYQLHSASQDGAAHIATAGETVTLRVATAATSTTYVGSMTLVGYLLPA